MIIAYLETTSGRISIGLVDMTKEEMEGPLQPFDALLNTLIALRPSLMLTSTHAFFGNAPAGTPATMTFKYLGTQSVEFPSAIAFYESANAYLARGVYECPDTFGAAEDGTFRAQCEYFQLIGEEERPEVVPSLH